MYHGEHGIALPAEIGIDAEHETHHDAIYAVSPEAICTTSLSRVKIPVSVSGRNCE